MKNYKTFQQFKEAMMQQQISKSMRQQQAKNQGRPNEPIAKFVDFVKSIKSMVMFTL